MIKAIFPGTFDPITLGHVDLIERAAKLFDEVIVAVAENPKKQSLFSLEERTALATEATQHLSKVTVASFSNLLVEFAKTHDVSVIVRGLRAVADFEYELGIAKMNQRLAPEIETIYLTPPSHLSFVASSIVREVASLHGDVSSMVHPTAVVALKAKFEQ